MLIFKTQKSNQHTGTKSKHQIRIKSKHPNPLLIKTPNANQNTESSSKHRILVKTQTHHQNTDSSSKQRKPKHLIIVKTQ